MITRYQPERVANDNMISVNDIEEMLGVEVAGGCSSGETAP